MVAISRLVLVGVLFGLGNGSGVVAQTPTPAPAPARVTWGADLRAGYFALHRHERTGGTTSTDDLRARARIHSILRIGERWEAGLRIAGRFSSDQESASFYVRTHAPTTDGLRLGEATIDEAYIGFRPFERVSVRAGRMQTKFALADLQGKSLDRGDSPNTDITWTDGVHVTYMAGGKWRSHVVLQHNAREGATNVLRSPLAFTHPRSRVTVFGAIEKTDPEATVAQQGVDVTYIARGLRPHATADIVEDYVAVVGRGSLAWPIGESGRLSLGGEVGYAPRTPELEALQLGEEGSGDAGGVALQLGLTLRDLVPGHRAGIVYGYTQAGWLIAPDFRNNDRLIELRYQRVLTPRHTFEARLRHRRDLIRPVAAERVRSDLDYYVRFSLRF